MALHRIVSLLSIWLAAVPVLSSGPACIAADTVQRRIMTLKDRLDTLQSRYGVSFVYDSSINLDIPYTGGPADMEDSLEKALEKTFRNTGVLWKLKRKYVILEQAPAVEVRDSIAGRAARHHYGVKDLHGPLQTGGEQDPDWSRAHRRRKV